MKQRQENKLATPFAPEPYEVISKHGNSVVIESPQGVQYKRNSTHVKKYFPREENLPPPADETHSGTGRSPSTPSICSTLTNFNQGRRRSQDTQ